MTIDEKLRLAKELISQKEEIDAKLAALFGGEDVRVRKRQACGHCGSPEHNKRACPVAVVNPVRLA